MNTPAHNSFECKASISRSVRSASSHLKGEGDRRGTCDGDQPGRDRERTFRVRATHHHVGEQTGRLLTEQRRPSCPLCLSCPDLGLPSCGCEDCWSWGGSPADRPSSANQVQRRSWIGSSGPRRLAEQSSERIGGSSGMRGYEKTTKSEKRVLQLLIRESVGRRGKSYECERGILWLFASSKWVSSDQKCRPDPPRWEAGAREESISKTGVPSFSFGEKLCALNQRLYSVPFVIQSKEQRSRGC